MKINIFRNSMGKRSHEIQVISIAPRKTECKLNLFCRKFMRPRKLKNVCVGYWIAICKIARNFSPFFGIGIFEYWSMTFSKKLHLVVQIFNCKG